MNMKGQMWLDRLREVLKPAHRVGVRWPGRGHARRLAHVRSGASTPVPSERNGHLPLIQAPGTPDRLMTLPAGDMRGA